MDQVPGHFGSKSSSAGARAASPHDAVRNLGKLRSSMDNEPVEIIQTIRRMRGNSQAHLVEGSDGHFYVAKFMGNPQGTRTLINEWFAHQLFRQLGISTPSLRVLRLPQAVQASSENFVFQCGNTRVAVEPGLHLGSQCPVNPTQAAIFDFLPRPVLCQVINRNDFAKALVLDLFLAQADTRQAIFVREESGKVASKLRAYLIDNGWTLGGNAWNFHGGSPQGFYWDRAIYSTFDLHMECESALNLITAITKEDLFRLGESIPHVWFSKGDLTDWARLLDLLSARKNQMPQLWFDHLKTLHRSQPGNCGRAISKEKAADGDPTAVEPQRPSLALLPTLC